MDDWRARERELCEQIVMLQSLAAPTESGGTSSSEDKVKLSKLTKTDDIKA